MRHNPGKICSPDQTHTMVDFEPDDVKETKRDFKVWGVGAIM